MFSPSLPCPALAFTEPPTGAARLGPGRSLLFSRILFRHDAPLFKDKNRCVIQRHSS
jgi:hypothetical protein